MFALIGICLLFDFVFSAPTESPVVCLDSGTYRGVHVSKPLTGVNKFLGIPFAEKPVRFSPPVPASDSSEFRDATKVGPACVQQFNCKFPFQSQSYTEKDAKQK
jgi:carboxylesterase type B